jgi:hypothetical protein
MVYGSLVIRNFILSIGASRFWRIAGRKSKKGESMVSATAFRRTLILIILLGMLSLAACGGDNSVGDSSLANGGNGSNGNASDGNASDGNSSDGAQYTVTFMNGYTVLSTQTMLGGEAASKPADPAPGAMPGPESAYYEIIKIPFNDLKGWYSGA